MVPAPTFSENSCVISLHNDISFKPHNLHITGIFLTYETPQYHILSYAQEGNKCLHDFRPELKTEKTDYELMMSKLFLFSLQGEGSINPKVLRNLFTDGPHANGEQKSKQMSKHISQKYRI